MSTAAKVWLWIVLILNALSFIGNVFTLVFLGAVVNGLLVGGAFYLLFKRQRMGFYAICVGAVLGLVVNIISGGGIVSAVISAILNPLITWLFLKKDFDKLQ